jgi:hypothetical protein
MQESGMGFIFRHKPEVLHDGQCFYLRNEVQKYESLDLSKWDCNSVDLLYFSKRPDCM